MTILGKKIKTLQQGKTYLSKVVHVRVTETDKHTQTYIHRHKDTLTEKVRARARETGKEKVGEREMSHLLIHY